jgi:hypothetical protein
MLEGPGDICLDFSPNPPLCFVSQMIAFVNRHKFFHTARQVLSDIGYLFGRLGTTKSWVEFILGEIDNVRHNVNDPSSIKQAEGSSAQLSSSFASYAFGVIGSVRCGSLLE